ncbi:type VI secretion system baseplate subunit TssG [Acidibrevibacterium fodinaquatile]|uniref:type VI secretion system baseplate subunit TssG n=1 Tax=Acidibrevibacterium fodinaquatile TaxID=1969806 RepID=UPI000E0D01E4|nr:type VI secretion system baseplate subunit TssG [Acidibrevibacterium fodinaquatile]
MAGSDGRDGAALSARLLAEPFRFDVRQAVRLLEWIARRSAEAGDAHASGAVVGPLPLGLGSDPRHEAVRLRGSFTDRFPPSDIEALSRDPADGQPVLTVAFFGLGGALGPLPPPLSARVVARTRAHDYAARDFLDIFNHRLLSLFLRQWRLFHPALQDPDAPASPARLPLLALLGLATLPESGPAAAASRLPGVMQSLIAAAGLLNPRPVSGQALQRLLANHFGVPVRLRPLQGRWLLLAADQLTRLGQTGMLGRGAMLGRKVWDQQAGLEIEIGPMAWLRFLPLLPGGAGHDQLQALVAFALGGAFDVNVRLLLRAAEVPGARLGRAGARLGWTSFLGRRPRVTPGAVSLSLQGMP